MSPGMARLAPRLASLCLAFALAPAAVEAQPEERTEPEEEAVTTMPEPPSERPHVDEAAAIMARYAERTGLTSERPDRRYLWTDAFAVGNYLGLARATGDDAYRERATRLVDRVHHTLGQHRPDDTRRGWLGEASEAHPTRGGLRIGKPRPERGPDEPFDPRAEWDRDGQYFHYLTKWMHALDLMARATGEARYERWAHELAETAHEAFVVRGSGGSRRMVWKMSIDLSRPLVPSMGQHDPLDGWVTYAQLEAGGGEPSLRDEIGAFRSMVSAGRLVTDDPLGLGGLLVDAYRVHQLREAGAFVDEDLLPALLDGARQGLEAYLRGRPFDAPATGRLAFRELGLAIGLAGVTRMAAEPPADPSVRRRVEALAGFADLRHALTSFWLSDRHQQTQTWREHRDIDEVMLATALVPDGVLVLPRSSP